MNSTTYINNSNPPAPAHVAESIDESSFAATAEEQERTLNVARKAHTADLCQAEAYDYIIKQTPAETAFVNTVCIDMPFQLNHYTPGSNRIFPLPFNLTTTLLFILLCDVTRTLMSDISIADRTSFSQSEAPGRAQLQIRVDTSSPHESSIKILFRSRDMAADTAFCSRGTDFPSNPG
jgi:hypothetical protein